jgi:chromosome segregation ATPase
MPMTAQAPDLQAQQETLMESGDRLADLDKEQLKRHIQALEQKLARTRGRTATNLLSEPQQKKLLELLEQVEKKEEVERDLRNLVKRATELNQRSEQIQQDIHGLNIVSENATNKCYEITYDAQHVIDQNQRLQQSLTNAQERSNAVNERCEKLAEELARGIEESSLALQKMDSATDRSHSTNVKSRQLLEELSETKHEVQGQVSQVQQAVELCRRSNEESNTLQRQLETLGQQLGEDLETNREQIQATNQVLHDCRQIAKEASESRQHTERVLDDVTSSNEESRDLISRMDESLQRVTARQKENQALNLDLQHSLQRNQQQREELIVLTSECREVRDQSVETQKQNETSIKDALEKLSVALAETRQGKMQVDRVLKEVFENNRESKTLIESMTGLQDSAIDQQNANSKLNDELSQVLEESAATRSDLQALVTSCRDTRDKTQAVLENSVQINGDAQDSIVRINEYMDSMRAIRDEMKGLIATSERSNAEANESLDSMRTNIDNSTLIQKECIRLNKESVATTLEAKRATEKLTEELESSVKLNDHYQDRMKAAEQKYQAALEAESKYRELYDDAVKSLKENESLLGKARATIKEHAETNAEYTRSIKQFQETTVQSQQIIMEAQTSIKTLMAKNEQLAEENRFLKGQVSGREPVAPDNVWPTLEDELIPDDKSTRHSNGFDRLDKIHQF